MKFIIRLMCLHAMCELVAVMLVNTSISENTAVVLAAMTDTKSTGNDKVKMLASARVLNARDESRHRDGLGKI